MPDTRPVFKLDPYDRVTVFGHIVCRPTRTTSDGQTLLVLQDPCELLFMSHEEFFNGLVSGEIRIEPRYFKPIKAARQRANRKRRGASSNTLPHHPGNGTVH